MSNPFEEITERLIRIENTLSILNNPRKEELKYLSREEVCTILKISLPTLNSYNRSGIIKGSRIGNRVLYLESDIQEAIQDGSTLRYKRH